MEMLMQIVIYLSVFASILFYIVLFAFKDIKERFLWTYFRKDYIRAIIIYKDRIMSDKPIKVKGQVDFKDGDRTYTIDHNCVYLHNGKTPCMIYEADDPQPKNVLSEEVEQVLKCPDCESEITLTFKKPTFPSGEELDNMMMRAKSAGLIKGLMKELPRLIMLLYLAIGVGVIAVGGIYILYKQLPEAITTALLPQLKAIITGTIIR
jgi:hypothetical protein